LRSAKRYSTVFSTSLLLENRWQTCYWPSLIVRMAVTLIITRYMAATQLACWLSDTRKFVHAPQYTKSLFWYLRQRTAKYILCIACLQLPKRFAYGIRLASSQIKLYCTSSAKINYAYSFQNDVLKYIGGITKNCTLMCLCVLFICL
jgi:hypothetical protein